MNKWQIFFINEVTEWFKTFIKLLYDDWLINTDSYPINTFYTKQKYKIKNRYQNEVNLIILKIKFDLLIHQTCETSLLPARLSKWISK